MGARPIHTERRRRDVRVHQAAQFPRRSVCEFHRGALPNDWTRGELMIAVAAWIAKQERTRISERVRVGLSRAIERGTRSGKPIGRPKLIFDRPKIADLRTEGRSRREIARACNAGVTTVRGVYGTSG